ncbi:MAG: nucleotide sugar dehydrogenase [Verrucomicrobiales bacterium]
MTSPLQAKVDNKEMVVGVIGLGYVGLPLLLNFTARGFHVIGFDIDDAKVNRLKDGQSYIEHIPSDPIRKAREAGLLDVTTDFSRAAETDALVICVPTPLHRHHEPDLSYVVSTIESIAPYVRAGQLVSLESTTYPGTTEEEVRPRLEAQGLRAGEDVFIVFSPEREDPGNPQFHGVQIPKVVGGCTPNCLAAGVSLYGAIYDKVVPVSSTQVAEFSKLLENIYRAVNIGLVNEMKLVADRMGIDIWEVIQAASSKPFGFTAFYPGPGLGGHCIPIDPFYLTWKAREYGIHTRFIELAGEINESMPTYVVNSVSEVLNTHGKPVRGSRILIMGLAYKANVDDMRESPSFKLMDLLAGRGATVEYYDPHIPIITPTREHATWTGKKSIPWKREAVSQFDVIVITTNHRKYNLAELAEWAPLIIDTRNAMAGLPVNGKLVKA